MKITVRRDICIDGRTITQQASVEVAKKGNDNEINVEALGSIVSRLLKEVAKLKDELK